jgi:hypothetical protein
MSPTLQRGGRNFVGPPIRLFGGFGASGGGVNLLIGIDFGAVGAEVRTIFIG